MCTIRPYLRSSREDKDAERAKGALTAWMDARDLTAPHWYVENISGTKLERPELSQLLTNAKDGDILLVEQIDRLTRLTAKDWETLKTTIKAKGLKIVSLDLPTSWEAVKQDGFTGAILEAVNSMLLDILAATARKDLEDRMRRTAEGRQKAKALGKYQGRPEDTDKLALIETCLKAGNSYSTIQTQTKASRATIAKVAARLKEAAQLEADML